MSSISNEKATVTTATATLAEHVPSADVEAQVAGKSATGENRNEQAGQGMGIAMVICTVISMIFLFVLPWISFVTIIATIVLSSIVSCGCCCANEYNLKSNVKKFATATLICCSLIFILEIIYIIAAAAALNNEVSSTGAVSQSTAQGVTVGAIVVFGLAVVLNAFAIIFSCLFTFGRGCCA